MFIYKINWNIKYFEECFFPVLEDFLKKIYNSKIKHAWKNCLRFVFDQFSEGIKTEENKLKNQI